MSYKLLDEGAILMKIVRNANNVYVMCTERLEREIKSRNQLCFDLENSDTNIVGVLTEERARLLDIARSDSKALNICAMNKYRKNL